MVLDRGTLLAGGFTAAAGLVSGCGGKGAPEPDVYPGDTTRPARSGTSALAPPLEKLLPDGFWSARPATLHRMPEYRGDPTLMRAPGLRRRHGGHRAHRPLVLIFRRSTVSGMTSGAVKGWDRPRERTLTGAPTGTARNRTRPHPRAPQADDRAPQGTEPKGSAPQGTAWKGTA